MTPGRDAYELEQIHFGRNMIATLTITGRGAALALGPAKAILRIEIPADPKYLADLLNIHLANKHEPLLWTYRSTPDSEVLEFGYDRYYLDGFERDTEKTQHHPTRSYGQKAGHRALTDSATISGEIFVVGNATHRQWAVNNDSGAWGGMGGAESKKVQAMLDKIARLISEACKMNVIGSLK